MCVEVFEGKKCRLPDNHPGLCKWWNKKGDTKEWERGVVLDGSEAN